MKKQLLENQKGEVEFRKKLYQQQVECKAIFHDEYDAAGIEKILADRMEKTHSDMAKLQSRGIPLLPFIEIGAERGQRSLVLENDFGASGAAIDISYDLLKSIEYYKVKFGKIKIPLRICCDANNLPFQSGSVAFVFCYETLHHFPDPAPITYEAYRVLQPGGCFFFDEEPFKQILHFGLYYGKTSYSNEYLNRSFIRKVCDRLFMKRTCNEADYGILENDKISLGEWKRAFSAFDASEVQINSRSLRTHLINSNSWLKYQVLRLIGGNISGICKKPGSITATSSQKQTIQNMLICPSCREGGIETLLQATNSSFLCPGCSKTYPIVDGVLFLFSYTKFAELYPEVFFSLQNTITHI